MAATQVAAAEAYLHLVLRDLAKPTLESEVDSVRHKAQNCYVILPNLIEQHYFSIEQTFVMISILVLVRTNTGGTGNSHILSCIFNMAVYQEKRRNRCPICG
jgi:hypothetical protein